MSTLDVFENICTTLVLKRAAGQQKTSTTFHKRIQHVCKNGVPFAVIDDACKYQQVKECVCTQIIEKIWPTKHEAP